MHEEPGVVCDHNGVGVCDAPKLGGFEPGVLQQGAAAQIDASLAAKAV